MTKIIPVYSKTQTLYATVDDADYERLSRMKWKIQRDSCNTYAATRRGGKTVFMHRMIINAPTGMMVDHKDRNGLHNTRSNLRLCTNSQNQCNSRLRKGSRSGYKGVCLRGDKIASRIKINGVSIFLGYFESVEDAARAYNEAAVKYHGEFARLNEI